MEKDAETKAAIEESRQPVPVNPAIPETPPSADEPPAGATTEAEPVEAAPTKGKAKSGDKA
jgi:hypothetical protein